MSERVLTLADFYNTFAGGSEDPLFKVTMDYQFFVEFVFPGDQAKFRSRERIIGTDVLGLMAHSVNTPDFSAQGHATESNTLGFMSFPSPGPINPSDPLLRISFLSTEFALHENMFVQWLAETTAGEYIYPDRPFTKAQVRVNLLNQAGKEVVIRYVFEEVFPVNVQTIKPDQGQTNISLVREVAFLFDWFRVDKINGTRPNVSRAETEVSGGTH